MPIWAAKEEEAEAASWRSGLARHRTIDFNWVDDQRAYRLRPYVDRDAVLAVNEWAAPGEAWGHLQGVRFHGGDAVRIASQIDQIVNGYRNASGLA